MSNAPDDPERLFRSFPKALRRWTFSTFKRRLRQSSRARRWAQRNTAAVTPYHRDDKASAPTKEAPAVYAIGDFSGRSGLSRAAQYELACLRKEYPTLVSRDLGAIIHSKDRPEPEPGPPIDRLYLLSAPDTYSWLFQAFPPERIRHAWRTGLWVWETPIFPSQWRFALPLIDEVWTPSEFSRQAILSAAGTRPVIVKPHAVEVTPRSDDSAIRARYGIEAGAFMGLAIMDIMSCPARKNPWAHVAAWQNAFAADANAVLLMKIRVSKRTRIVLDELREMIGTAPNIRILEAELNDEDITALQASAEVYLSLHRAEGYGLNIHECLALGTHVVATDFSANAEYGPQFEGYHPVPYRMVPYRDWTGHYADRDFEWAEADIDAAAKSLKRLREAQA